MFCFAFGMEEPKQQNSKSTPEFFAESRNTAKPSPTEIRNSKPEFVYINVEQGTHAMQNHVWQPLADELHALDSRVFA